MSTTGGDGVRDAADLVRLAPQDDALLARCRAIVAAFCDLPADATGPQPPPHPAHVRDVLRDDVPRRGLAPADALAAAPDAVDGTFRTPRVRDVS